MIACQLFVVGCNWAILAILTAVVSDNMIKAGAAKQAAADKLPASRHRKQGTSPLANGSSSQLVCTITGAAQVTEEVSMEQEYEIKVRLNNTRRKVFSEASPRDGTMCYCLLLVCYVLLLVNDKVLCVIACYCLFLAALFFVILQRLLLPCHAMSRHITSRRRVM